jgi:hypothetical protein
VLCASIVIVISAHSAIAVSACARITLELICCLHITSLLVGARHGRSGAHQSADIADARMHRNACAEWRACDRIDEHDARRVMRVTNRV